ncbi:hypothetical protein OMCYN_01667 [cyanobiont of Ornithocercus magnificus]|nr:hypothetical protein OMCYN_01667 [cyanobiont of Ornithocercus magnificus]
MNTESTNSLPIADEYSIPSLPELCAYRLGDTGYLSMRQVVASTRGNMDTRSLKRWLNSGAKPLQGKGSDALERNLNGSQIPVLIRRPDGSTTKATLIPCATVVRWLIFEARNHSPQIRGRATGLLVRTGTVGLDSLVAEACGVKTSALVTMSAWVLSRPTDAPAVPITQVKRELIALGYRDRCARMGCMVNDLFYNRLPEGVLPELKRIRRYWYQYRYGQKCLGPTQFEFCHSNVHAFFNQLAGAAIVLIKDTRHSFSIREIVWLLDKIAPRTRHSLVPIHPQTAVDPVPAK